LCVGKPEDPGGTGTNNRMFVEAVKATLLGP
jgi:hypothetical protein